MERSDVETATDVPASQAQNPHCLFCREQLRLSPRDDASWVDLSGRRACSRSTTGQHKPSVQG